MKLDLEVVIPVLVPSEFLSIMYGNLANNKYGIKAKFVLDYARSDIDLPISKPEFDSECAVSISGKFGSPGVARNKGLRSSQSTFVAFWDVDDEPNMGEVSSLVRDMQLNGADVGVGNWAFLDQPDCPVGTDVLSVGRSPGMWRFVFRREFIEGILFSDLKWGEDQLFVAEVLARTPKIITSERTTYFYRKNSPNGLTSNHSNVKDLYNASKKLCLVSNKASAKLGLCLEIMLISQISTIFKYGGVGLGSKSVVNVLRTHSKLVIIRNLMQLFCRGARSWN